MKTKTFKPILAPNQEANLDEIKYPIMASYKLDGIRCIFYKGQILSRSLKPIQNKQLRKKFESLRKYSEDENVILDGEIYSPELTFQEITSFVMTQDLEDKRSIKKFGKILEIPNHLKFYCFDILDKFTGIYKPFEKRYEDMLNIEESFNNNSSIVLHKLCHSKDEIEDRFDDALGYGFEGLILRDPKGKYKFGRGTLKEGIIYKVKPYRTFDAVITGVVQSTVVDPNAEKKINELGRSVTSKKKDDRILIEKASAFNVNYEIECDLHKNVFKECVGSFDCYNDAIKFERENPKRNGEIFTHNGYLLKESFECSCNGTGKIINSLKVVLAMTDEEKEQIWQKREEFIGQWIEYKGMLIGAKDVPRHPVMTRFRKDKD